MLRLAFADKNFHFIKSSNIALAFKSLMRYWSLIYLLYNCMIEFATTIIIINPFNIFIFNEANGEVMTHIVGNTNEVIGVIVEPIMMLMFQDYLPNNLILLQLSKYQMKQYNA